MKWNEMSANSAISIRLCVTYLDKNWHLIHFTNRLNVVDGYLFPFLFITTSSTSHSCHIVYENLRVRWIYVILSLQKVFVWPPAAMTATTVSSGDGGLSNFTEFKGAKLRRNSGEKDLLLNWAYDHKFPVNTILSGNSHHWWPWANGRFCSYFVNSSELKCVCFRLRC